MVVVSVRMKRLKTAVLIVFVTVIIAFLVLIIKQAIFSNNTEGIMLPTDNDRVVYLTQCGWLVNKEPISVMEVTIPSEFNNTYTAYNDIQKKQGFNLDEYKGKTVTKYVYEVKNSSDSNFVQATLLIFNDRLIGGDVSSLEVGSPTGTLDKQ